MSKVIVAAVALLLCGTCFAKNLQIQVKSPSTGLVSATGIWMDDVGASVVVWFHGGMTSGNCEKGYVAGRDISEMVPSITSVSVSACKNNHWVTPVAAEWVDAALDSLARIRNAPVDSVYLVGISDGSLGVIAYSMWGRRFPAARLLMSSYGAALGSAAELARQKSLQRGRWLFMQGGADRLYPSQATVPWIEEFCKNVGVECNLKYDPAGEHDWSYWQNKHKDWILDIFSQKPLTKRR